jgi:hypothetical protein
MTSPRVSRNVRLWEKLNLRPEDIANPADGMNEFSIERAINLVP